jgi:SSS family transporter
MIYLIPNLIYLASLVVLGIYLGKKVKTEDDFMVAGRNLSTKVLVGTLLATWIGSGSIIGGAGLAYRKGISALWFNAGVWIAIIILYYIAPRARMLAQYTIGDILELKYNKYARVLGSIVLIIAYTAITSYQFKAGGMVLNVITGIPVIHGIIITAVFVILYTVLAGMLSVAYADVINGIVMTIGLILGFGFLISHGGGLNNILNSLPPHKLTIFGDMSLLEAFSYTLPTMLLLLGESNMYQRFFSAKNSSVARRATVWWIVGTIFIEGLIVFYAIIASGIFTNINPEQALIHSTKYGLPTIIGVITFAALISIIISTADSFLLAPTTSIIHDIYQRFINPNADNKKIIRLSRICVVLLGGFAFLQLQFFPTVLAMALYAYTIYGVGITPALLACFLSKRVTVYAGSVSILLGMVTTITWEILKTPYNIPTVYPALLASLLGLVVTSMVTSKKKDIVFSN